MPKVTVIMPSLNVQPYIRECMDSVVNQTLKDIEIICVDAGSTDGTLEILREYVKNDERIQIIISDKRSYGYQMNIGIAAAKGDYIGIVETDDWIDEGMFAALYNIASANDAEIVKSNYYWYTTSTAESLYFDNLKRCTYNKVFCPLSEIQIFEVTPSIWSGIYDRQFLERNNIRFNASAGASYQDISFHFSVFSVASRVVLVEDAYLHYRKDNMNSSVNSKEKIYCVVNEMAYYESFLSKFPEKEMVLRKYIPSWKAEKYLWNLRRIGAAFQWEFIKFIYKEFWGISKFIAINKDTFSHSNWDAINLLLSNPRLFYLENGDAPLDPRVSFADGTCNIVKQVDIEEPLVSIIIPIYNTAQYLLECLQSIANQTINQIEIICVDDGSTDESLAMLVDFSKNDNRIAVITQNNGGLSVARNTGLKHAHGKYVCFVDSDDMLVPNALEIMTAYAEKGSLDILYFDATTVFDSHRLEQKHANYRKCYSSNTEDNSIYSGDRYFCEAVENKRYRVSVCMQLMRRGLIEENQLWFEPGIAYEDNIYTFVSMLRSKRVQHIGSKLYIRRIRSESIMTSAVSLWHLYSYLVCFKKIAFYSESLEQDERLNRALDKRFCGLRNLVRKTYQKLDSVNRGRVALLSDLDRFWLSLLLSSDSTKGILTSEDNEYIKKVSGHFLRRSYKIGCTMTWLPRKIRGGIQCYKDHSCVYTVRRLKEKIDKKFHRGILSK